MVVINWNIPMHLFLKECKLRMADWGQLIRTVYVDRPDEHLVYCSICTDVFKPSLSYVGRFGAVLLTYIASAMLHVSYQSQQQ